MGNYRPSPGLIRDMRRVIDAAKAAGSWPAKMLREQEAKLRRLELGEMVGRALNAPRK